MTITRKEQIEKMVKLYINNKHLFQSYLDYLLAFFTNHPDLMKSSNSPIHSIKYRLKDPDHLYEKINRKSPLKDKITANNLFKKVTDLAGIRILHMHRDQIISIHSAIMNSCEHGEFVLAEKPKAYSWDPENSTFFKDMGLKVEIKPSYYTSVHYLIKAKKNSPICCEVQVRTLFEEIWGEIDHQVNYPKKTTNKITTDQLKALAKLIAAGGKLCDSIKEHHK